MYVVACVCVCTCWATYVVWSLGQNFAMSSHLSWPTQYVTVTPSLDPQRKCCHYALLTWGKFHPGEMCVCGEGWLRYFSHRATAHTDSLFSMFYLFGPEITQLSFKLYPQMQCLPNYSVNCDFTLLANKSLWWDMAKLSRCSLDVQACRQMN